MSDYYTSTGDILKKLKRTNNPVTRSVYKAIMCSRSDRGYLI